MEPIFTVTLLYIFPVLLGNWIAGKIPSDEIVWAFATHKLYIHVRKDRMQDVLASLSVGIVRTTDIAPWGDDQIILTIYTPERKAVCRKMNHAQSLEGVQSVSVIQIRSKRSPFS